MQVKLSSLIIRTHRKEKNEQNFSRWKKKKKNLLPSFVFRLFHMVLHYSTQKCLTVQFNTFVVSILRSNRIERDSNSWKRTNGIFLDRRKGDGEKISFISNRFKRDGKQVHRFERLIATSFGK